MIWVYALTKSVKSVELYKEQEAAAHHATILWTLTSSIQSLFNF